LTCPCLMFAAPVRLLRHPHEPVLPFRRLAPATIFLFPQLHRQRHVALPLASDSARRTTVSRPKRRQVISLTALKRYPRPDRPQPQESWPAFALSWPKESPRLWCLQQAPHDEDAARSLLPYKRCRRARSLPRRSKWPDEKIALQAFYAQSS
jgi:hypothetical protein